MLRQQLIKFSVRTLKEKYLFWSLVVFILSLFSFCPSYHCFPSPSLLDLTIINAYSHLSFLYIYYLNGRIAFRVKNQWSFDTRKKIAIGFQWPFMIFGILCIVLTLYGSIKNSGCYGLQGLAVGIALIVSSLEKIKKLKNTTTHEHIS